MDYGMRVFYGSYEVSFWDKSDINKVCVLRRIKFSRVVWVNVEYWEIVFDYF